MPLQKITRVQCTMASFKLMGFRWQKYEIHSLGYPHYIKFFIPHKNENLENFESLLERKVPECRIFG